MTAEAPAQQTPTGTIHQWFPASVQVGDTQSWIRNARVILAPEGLFVYLKPDEVRAYWPVAWDATQKPISSQATRMNGNQIVTTYGETITIHATGTCGCGNPLKSWVPTFAGVAAPWPAEASL